MSLFILPFLIYSQEGIGIGTTTPDPSSILDITSSDKGILIPRLDTSAVLTLTNGLLLFQPSDQTFYFYNGNEWVNLLKKSDTVLIKDNDGDTKIQVEENPDEDIIRVDLAGEEILTIEKNNGQTRFEIPNTNDNIFIGESVSKQISGGNKNTVIGTDAVKKVSTSVDSNTIIGYAAAFDSLGNANSFFGFNAGAETGGNKNIAIGVNAGNNDNGASNNIYIGHQSGTEKGLITGNLGDNNIFIGNQTEYQKLIGSLENSVAIGTSKNISKSNTIYLGDHFEINETGQVSLVDPVLSEHAVSLGYLQNNYVSINSHRWYPEEFTHINHPTTYTIRECAEECRDLIADGHDDWVLPSIEQLSQFAGILGSDADDPIWTSSFGRSSDTTGRITMRKITAQVGVINNSPTNRQLCTCVR